MPDTDMELTHMPLDTPMVVTHMPMVPTTERDLLMPSQRLRLMLLSSTELMDMVDTVLDMPDTDMELTHMLLDTPMVVTHMPMVPTTERDLLMPSQRLRLMLLFSTELMDMVDTVLDMLDTDMELPHMPLDTPMVVTHMPMVPPTERDLLMPSQKLMLPTCMELTDMVDTVLDTDPTDMDTHMLMVDMDTHMPMESKL